MTTTELIKLLQDLEFGGSGRPREISFFVGKKFIPNPDIKFEGSGDGIAGAELCLRLIKKDE